MLIKDLGFVVGAVFILDYFISLGDITGIARLVEVLL